MSGQQAIRVRGKDVRAQLSQLLEQVNQGQHVFIRYHERPVAALIPYPEYQQLPSRPQEALMHVISIYNQAGGVDKTTVTRDLGYAIPRLTC